MISRSQDIRIRRRYRSSSSSSSSAFYSLTSYQTSKMSKGSRHSNKFCVVVSRHSHKKFCIVIFFIRSVKNNGGYKRRRHPSPQVVEVQSTVQTARTVAETPNIHSDNVGQHFSKTSGTEPEVEAWSFDRAINEVFRQLPEQLYPKPFEDHTSSNLFQ